MLRFLRNKKAQSTLEYAILIIVVLGALLSMQMYIKRGVQGRYRQATDDIGDQFSPGNTRYYRSTTTQTHSNETTIDGQTESRLLDDEWTNVTYSANLINVQQEYWGSETE